MTGHGAPSHRSARTDTCHRSRAWVWVSARRRARHWMGAEGKLRTPTSTFCENFQRYKHKAKTLQPTANSAFPSSHMAHASRPLAPEPSRYTLPPPSRRTHWPTVGTLRGSRGASQHTPPRGASVVPEAAPTSPRRTRGPRRGGEPADHPNLARAGAPRVAGP